MFWRSFDAVVDESAMRRLNILIFIFDGTGDIILDAVVDDSYRLEIALL